MTIRYRRYGCAEFTGGRTKNERRLDKDWPLWDSGTDYRPKIIVKDTTQAEVDYLVRGRDGWWMEVRGVWLHEWDGDLLFTDWNFGQKWVTIKDQTDFEDLVEREQELVRALRQVRADKKVFNQ